ncbi:hormogonium polysaccharide biosynthesis protein HpsA [Microcoleus sp. LAD1_D5]|uniref:hormogonium polysaccharide biosynthesis protein HpsA n=1 Tax=unclassified Microcoleus TaxID=2642155 RepID=UPI002FD75ED5
MFKSKLSKVIVSLLRRIAGVTRSGAKRLMRAMLQTLMAMGRRARLPMAGFVLPTVTMVLLVVILLTVAITLRSFDRANTARNVRVNQQVLAAATPALDRAKAKIQYALSPQGSGTLETPSELSVYQALDSARFKFGDEDVLQVKVDLNNVNGIIDPAPTDLTKINESERINTAWRFPVDTDNNGKFDTYTLYGIYFRSPPRDPDTGEFNRARKGLEARTPPMSVSGTTSAICKAAAGTSASLVGSSDWYKAEGVLKKSFFVYTVNVPISDLTGVATPANYEKFKGSPSFSALEYQQDQKRIPLQNNAVVYEDDLEVSPGPALRLNGRIFTNSNFVVTHTNTGPVTFYLVSSKESCFYNLENSKIIVSGNVVNGTSGGPGNISTEVGAHLFGTTATDPELGKSIKGPDQQSVAYNAGALGVIYNNKAYSDRIGLLVSEQEKNAANSDPLEVKNALAKQVDEETDPTPPSAARQEEIRREKLESYFRLRTRKVPFAEVSATGDALIGFVDPTTKVVTTSPLVGTGDELRPVDAWVIPSDANTGLNTTVRLAANSPEKVEEDNKESELGDRIIVGNNLPALRWRSDLNPPKFVGEGEEGRDILGVDWLDGGQRYREPQVKQFADVGGADRDGFWELSAAQAPETAVDGIGGLRVITGAGVYERTNSFLPPPKVFNPAANAVSEFYDDPATTAVVEKFPVVWPDSMPMSPGPNSKVYNNNPAGTIGWTDLTATDWNALPTTPGSNLTGTIDPKTPQYAKGDLRMRATAIYHYANNPSPGAQTDKLADTPLACVSSYYDPSYRYSKGGTLFDSSLNRPGLPSGQNANGKSNNGIVYGYNPPTARAGIGAILTAALQTDASSLPPLTAGTIEERLNYQASIVFPDGRFVNENLRKALQKVDGERSLSEKAAIDSTLCSLQILADPTTGFSTTYLDHGTIREVAFLNPREVKAIDKDDPATAVDETYSLSSPLGGGAQSAKLTGNYDLPLAERQPLEIRVTQLDINKLRGNTKTIPYQRQPVINTLNPEYMLPYSGLIYASRDDAAPDRSDRPANSLGTIDETRSKLSSSTDSRLDPSRRPHGIMLINGSSLGRPTTVATVTDVLKEKGLLLTSNLPVYIQGAFNTHTQREFGTGVANPFDWTPSTFYGRLGTDLNPNFACRLGDPRYPGKCAGSDNWRGATVLSDAITLLSEPESANLQEGFRYGIRNHGDFDLRNNAGSAIVGYDFDGNGILGTNTVSEVTFDFDLNGNGNKIDTTVKETDVTAKAVRRINGFGANNYVTNGLSSGAAFDIINQEKVGLSAGTTVSPKDENYRTNIGAAPNSSYFNNFITPVQRRANNAIKFPEYVMEICRKLPVSACAPSDWVVGIDGGTAGEFEPTEIQKARLVPAATPVGLLLSGTTAKPAIDPADRRYPRRVAFVRDSSGKLVLDNPNSLPIALGITSNAVAFYATSTTAVTVDGTAITPVTGQPQLADNALWYATTKTPLAPNTPTQIDYGNANPLFYAKLPTANVEQPQLRPTLQIQATNSNPVAGLVPIQGPNANDGTRWMQRARNTEFNLIVASNDVPSRALSPSLGETNGGMQNLPRFMENWRELTTSIAGSFIQFKRSAYATAPYQSVLDIANTSPFNAKIFDSRLDIPADTRSIYRVQNALGAIGYFVAPDRLWGFDVGLLSQPPDLFAQKFTLPATQQKPDEYFREISRDDDWVKALLCAEKLNNDTARTFSGNYAANDSATKPRTDCPNLS